MLLRLHTADHIRLASPVQEEQGAVAPCDRTRVMGFAMGDAYDALSVLFQYRGGRIFSAMLWPHNGLPSFCEEQRVEIFLEYIPPLTNFS